VWDWAPGEDFVARTHTALESSNRLLAVCTQVYCSSAFSGAQLRAAFIGQAKDQGRIVRCWWSRSPCPRSTPR
jgi:hypothetical protein